MMQQLLLPAPALRVCIIGCSDAKNDTQQAAETLYRSQLFAKSRRYASSAAFDRWFIVSARYGLVEPSQIIAPYDMRLRAADAGQWAHSVVNRLRHELQAPADVTILAGALYADPIADCIEERRRENDQGWVAVRRPLAGLGIDRRLQFLSAA